MNPNHERRNSSTDIDRCYYVEVSATVVASDGDTPRLGNLTETEVDLTMTDVLGRASAARDESGPGEPLERFSRLVKSLTLYHSWWTPKCSPVSSSESSPRTGRTRRRGLW